MACVRVPHMLHVQKWLIGSMIQAKVLFLSVAQPRLSPNHFFLDPPLPFPVFENSESSGLHATLSKQGQSL